LIKQSLFPAGRKRHVRLNRRSKSIKFGVKLTNLDESAGRIEANSKIDQIGNNNGVNSHRKYLSDLCPPYEDAIALANRSEPESLVAY